LIDNFSLTQTIRKSVVPTAGGVVSAQHRVAAEVGAAVLAAGADAVDAAVATSFALGVVEPWMSGIAGGGCMVIWRAREQQARVVNFGMRSPKGLDPAHFPLAAGGVSNDLFGWPLVVDDRNVQGATAVAVPGVVAGMSLAHGEYGRLAWRELVEPAVRLAREGLLCDWYSGLITASNAKALSTDADAAAMFLDEGKWPILGTWTGGAARRLDQSRLAESLAQIAHEGAGALYGGDVGQAMAADVQAKGGFLALADLADYRAEWAEPLRLAHSNGVIWAAPGLTGGPTFGRALESLQSNPHWAGEAGPTRSGSHPDIDAEHYRAIAAALSEAFAARFANMGDHETHSSPGSTTHFCVVDRHGNFCSVTQTLLSIFGSRVVSPSTGVLLNNGIMWFDPVPGRPNSLAPDKRCLANYCPVIGSDSQGRMFALGASGGRKILGAVLQLAMFLSRFGMSLEQAFHQPRIDVSGLPTITVDPHLGPAVRDAVADVMPVVQTRRVVFPYAFACPAGVLREVGMNSGCTEIMSPYGDAAAEGGISGTPEALAHG
jgi:gamma-glutamyltranspeptidase/glutathione hydrolase